MHKPAVSGQGDLTKNSQCHGPTLDWCIPCPVTETRGCVYAKQICTFFEETWLNTQETAYTPKTHIYAKTTNTRMGIRQNVPQSLPACVHRQKHPSKVLLSSFQHAKMIVNNRNFACLARVHYTALSLGLQVFGAPIVIRWVAPKFLGRPTSWSVDHHKIVSTECACSLSQTCCMRTTYVWKCFVYSHLWWFPGKWACRPTPNHVVVLKRTKRWWDRHGHFKSSNTCKPLLICLGTH